MSSNSFLEINFLSNRAFRSSRFSSSLLKYKLESSNRDSAPYLFAIELFNSDFAFSRLACFCFNLDFDMSTEVCDSFTLKVKGFWSKIARTSPFFICSLKSLLISTIFPDISDDNVNVDVGIILTVAETLFIIFPFSIFMY